MAKEVVFFGSAQPVTCAVMDYTYRLASAINEARPGMAEVQAVETANPLSFVSEIASVLRSGKTAHFQFPIEGWGNSLLPGSALLAARLLTRRGKLVATMHEWSSLHPLRYLSMVPDLFAIDQFVFVSAAQRAAFQGERFVSRVRREAAPVIPIGPNIASVPLDGDAVARARASVVGEGDGRADLVIGFFGVLYASKRPELLLEVTKSLHKRGVKARLLVCGDFLSNKPQDRDAFFARADELGVRSWLDFKGRIDDEEELMTTLSGADLMFLPYADGISARRGTFQATARLEMPLVSTLPERGDEFDFSALIRKKIDHPSTVLVPAQSDVEAFADAVLAAFQNKAGVVGVDLFGLWQEAATAHLALYDRLGGSAAMEPSAPHAAPPAR